MDSAMSIDISKTTQAPVPAVASHAAAKTAGDVAPVVQARKPVEMSIDPAQNEKAMREAIAQINQQMADHKQHLDFSHDSSIHGPVIVVTNSLTGEVIRKIPTEEVIRVAHSIDALKGILYSTKI
ncbi:MAG: flagellar protein FlaG [Betaproteobacteria bacterium]|nr:flagellar protein FlaG [Betaproteobacteria bacterium]